MSEVTRFSDEKVRPAADALAHAYNQAVAMANEWAARPEVQPDNDSVDIDDGSGDAGDGRPQLTGAKIHNIVSRMSEFVTMIDGTTVTGAVGKLDTILAMAVNTTPRV